MAGDGAEAAVLIGSYARWDAGPESDVDVLAVGPRTTFSQRLERRGGLLVSMSSRSPAAYRREMADPVPSVRPFPAGARPWCSTNPMGEAWALIEEVRAWTWGPLERRCEGWVAGEITALTVEVHKLVAKLVAALRAGRCTTAAVQRSVLAFRPAQVLAVHRRILYGSGNRLWDLVAEAIGQVVARGAVRRPRPEQGAVRGDLPGRAKLYGLAVDNVYQLLDERQRDVANHARLLAAVEG